MQNDATRCGIIFHTRQTHFWELHYLTFIGPSHESIKLLGDKAQAKSLAKRAPGSISVRKPYNTIDGRFRYLNRDSEEYKNLAPHVKDMNWTIPLKGGNFMYIPKPFEWGAMATILDRFWDTVGPQKLTVKGQPIYWAGGKEDFTWDKFTEIGSKVFAEQMRLDVTPQIIDPWLDLMINKRFTGSPLTPNFMKNYMPTEEGYYPWSNAAIVNVWQKYNLADKTNLSPIAFEHLLKTYTGAMGQYFLDFVIDPYGIPGIAEGRKGETEIMFDQPTITGGLEIFGVPIIPEDSDPGIFQDWNRVPLIKRMFSVAPQRHTQTLLEAYKLERELSKRIAYLKRFEPGKPSANSYMYTKLLNDPYMQDVLALDKALASQFDKIRKLSEMILLTLENDIMTIKNSYKYQ